MSRGKLATILAVAALACLLAPALADYGNSDWKDEKHGWKDDKHDWDDKHEWKDGKHEWKDGKHEWKDGKKEGWVSDVKHTEFLVCKHCGDYSVLTDSLLLNTFNMIKVYNVDLDTALCFTLHLVYLFVLILDKVLEQNLHALVDGLTRLLKRVAANPKLAPTLQETGLKATALFRCALTHLHKTFIF
ncbi:uncharacterized protein LOC126278366 [Schistocerca gregaria]|uniref:uncharacterized protein LOC126278366 n=1 Tax=Schistocerca gregaria TaxID=7010 RepID=UPI00211F1278|nr:uncharacterized protein LOC126278366 [Schistocerca gregaria]